MPRCKCRICGTDLDTEAAYKVTIKNKNKYYCSEEEYENYIKEREHADLLIAEIKNALKYILNAPAIVNTYVYKEWAETHECKFRIKKEWMSKPLRYVGAIGGEDTFCFTPTGLGTAVKVKCTCGAEINLTNYDEW